MKLVDDESVEIMFSAVTKSIELFVGKITKERVEEHLSSPVVSTGIGYFTDMLETVNPSVGLVSPSYSNPYLNVGSYEQASMSMQHPTQYSFPYDTQPFDPSMSQR